MTEVLCNYSENNCLANTYCPTENSPFTPCLPCNPDGVAVYKCNCKDKQVIYHCNLCQNGECVSCTSGYSLSNGECFKCEASCQTCSKDNFCDICNQGMYSENGRCIKCNSNCSDCSDGATCTKCDAGFYLESGLCTACKINKCSVCSEADKCEACEIGFGLQDGKCATSCSAENACLDEKTFCDLKSNTCRACGAGCTKCKNAEVCGGCDIGQQLNINGFCEASCTPSPTDGRYCKAGVATDCSVGLTSQCVCGAAENCASCNKDRDNCETCIPGFKINDMGVCIDCDAGYEKYQQLCLLIISPEGKCNSLSNSCKEDTFCPATDTIMIDCKNCDDSIVTDQGCNCEDSIQNTNCQTCASGKCSKCIQKYGLKNDVCEKCMDQNCLKCSESAICTKCDNKFYLNNNKCQECGKNCQECSAEKTCTSCDEKYKLVGGFCVPTCSTENPCVEESQFCDLAESVCKACKGGCNKCKNEEICGGCEDGKQLNINGVCEDSCTTPIIAGQYCKNGTPTACDAGITSQCKCGSAENCASCIVTNDKCETCLQGFKKDQTGVCASCAENYEKYEALCLKVGDDKEENAKLSGGAIAGIIIGVLVVVGGVAGGLAYYFIKKTKAGMVQPTNTAPMQ